MPSIEEFVERQKDGARFMITAQMMRLTPQEFHPIAQGWLDDGGPGFNIVGVPHRTPVDGEFYISRVTAVKTKPRPAPG